MNEQGAPPPVCAGGRSNGALGPTGTSSSLAPSPAAALYL
jgi:hypothetical protein